MITNTKKAPKHLQHLSLRRLNILEAMFNPRTFLSKTKEETVDLTMCIGKDVKNFQKNT